MFYYNCRASIGLSVYDTGPPVSSVGQHTFIIHICVICTELVEFGKPFLNLYRNANVLNVFP